MPPAPGRFSTMNGWPSSSLSLDANLTTVKSSLPARAYCDDDAHGFHGVGLGAYRGTNRSWRDDPNKRKGTANKQVPCDLVMSTSS